MRARDYEHNGTPVSGIEESSPPQPPARRCAKCPTKLSRCNSGALRGVPAQGGEARPKRSEARVEQNAQRTLDGVAKEWRTRMIALCILIVILCPILLAGVSWWAVAEDDTTEEDWDE